MKMLQMVLWTAAGVGMLGIVGCDLYVNGRARPAPLYVEQGPQYVAAPQPVYVEQPPQYVIVQQAPPPMRVEYRPAAPSVDVVWIDGYWNWSNQRYNWEAGRYVRPPSADVIWVAPRYESDARGGRYTAGQWVKSPGNGRGRGRGN
jgi:hypothetical protein